MSRTKFTALFCLSLALTLVLAACGSRARHEYLDTKSVVVESLTYKDDGDFMVVTAVLRNKSSSAVEKPVYRLEWFDADGNVIENTSWRPLIIKGGDTARVTERSTVPGAKECSLLLSNDAS